MSVLPFLQSRDPPPPASAADIQWNFVVATLRSKKKYARLKHRLTGSSFDAETTKDILNFVLALEPIEIESLRVALQVLNFLVSLSLVNWTMDVDLIAFRCSLHSLFSLITEVYAKLSIGWFSRENVFVFLPAYSPS